MEEPRIIRADKSVFNALPIIVEHDYVIVQQADGTVSGIVTASDVTVQFRELAEPFLLIGEIENHIRTLLDDRFSPDELRMAIDPADTSRVITGVQDLTFGEYHRLLSNPESWAQLGLPIDRGVFCKRLDEVRQIRNDVMHFDPDPFESNELSVLRTFAEFLRDLRRGRDGGAAGTAPE